MADIHTIRATTRDRAGKGPARSTRRSGRVPGVIYGEKEPPHLISVDPRELLAEMHHQGFLARLIHVEVDGTPHRALPRDVQLDPVTDQPLHVDFMRVGVGTRITVAVPVVFTNQETSPGLKRGGILNIVRHDIDLICSVDSIPDHLTISLEGLDIGDSIHISMINLPEGVRPTVTDRNFTIASIAAPTAVREEQLAAVAAAKAAGEAAAAAAAAPEAAAGAAPAGGGTAKS